MHIMSGQGITFVSSSDRTSQLPLLVPDDELLLVPTEGSEKYVVKDNKTGLFMATSKSFLPAKADEFDKEAVRFLVLGREEDISGRVGSLSPTYTLPMGVGYTDGSKSSAFGFRNAIVEYRSNVGKQSASPSKIPGKPTIYGVSYISVGIPKERYEWIKNCLTDLFDITLATGEKVSPKFSNGYYWITANISANSTPVAYATKDGKVQQMTLLSLLSAQKKSLTGTITCSMSLKRVVEGDEVVRALSMSFKFIQVVGFTDICSPPLGNTIAFAKDDNAIASNEFWEALESSKMSQSNAGSHPSKIVASNQVNASSS